MRAVLVLFALAAAAGAAPSIRWLDKTGGFQSAGVKRLVEETAVAITVEIEPEKDAAESEKPRVLTIPLAQVLEFVREDASDEEQKRLLEARTAVVAGVDLKQACETLDRLSQKAREPWVKEYAAAFRAIGARQRGEKDALERMTAFLRAHPDSRFVCAIIRARAWVESQPISDPLQIFDPFGEAWREIGKRNGPFRDQYGCIRDAGLRNTETHAIEMDGLERTLSEAVADKRPDASAAELTVRMSSNAEWRIIVAGIKWRQAIAEGVSTAVFRDYLAQVENSADLLLPDTIVDLRLEQGALAIAEKKFDDAERYYELAAKQDASQARRLMLQRARDQLSAARTSR